jgi:hypothetical protein
VILAVLFFGGFLVKSYWEEYVFNRDAEKLLAYYNHAIPGTISDGDKYNARYVVYKYRNKKQKLWSGLEKKYGIPVREAHEWADYETHKEDQEVNLDDEKVREDPSEEDEDHEEL